MGYCYVIINEGYPEWCKIGFTKRKPVQRLKEYQTYSPFSYQLYHAVEFDEPRAAESLIHKLLQSFTAKNKEWFKISPRIAANIIDGVRDDLNES